MRSAHQAKPSGAVEAVLSRALAIDAKLAGQFGDGLGAEIRRIVKSTRFDLDGAQVRLLGPDHFYHAFDPELDVNLRALRLPGTDQVGSFYRRTRRGGWCLEDCWSGRLIAEILSGCPAEEALVLLHVDDHEDMMPTLIGRHGDQLADPSTGLGFDPSAPADWDAPIRSGAIGIGNFITALFHSERCVHVRHLNNTEDGDRPTPAGPAGIRYPLIPDIEFAAVARDTPHRATGSYLAATDPARALAGLPAGHLVVHIDLDYFINDFNGNPGRQPLARDAAYDPQCRAKLEALFTAIRTLDRPVAGWVVATSPGFCASRHWRDLLAPLQRHLGDPLLPAGAVPLAPDGRPGTASGSSTRNFLS